MSRRHRLMSHPAFVTVNCKPAGNGRFVFSRNSKEYREKRKSKRIEKSLCSVCAGTLVESNSIFICNSKQREEKKFFSLSHPSFIILFFFLYVCEGSREFKSLSNLSVKGDILSFSLLGKCIQEKKSSPTPSDEETESFEWSCEQRIFSHTQGWCLCCEIQTPRASVLRNWNIRYHRLTLPVPALPPRKERIWFTRSIFFSIPCDSLTDRFWGISFHKKGNFLPNPHDDVSFSSLYVMRGERGTCNSLFLIPYSFLVHWSSRIFSTFSLHHWMAHPHIHIETHRGDTKGITRRNSFLHVYECGILVLSSSILLLPDS